MLKLKNRSRNRTRIFEDEENFHTFHSLTPEARKAMLLSVSYSHSHCLKIKTTSLFINIASLLVRKLFFH
jgi:hypothetical protein